jgi:hypothetical protein
MERPAYARRAKEVAGKVETEDGAAEAARIIGFLVENRCFRLRQPCSWPIQLRNYRVLLYPTTREVFVRKTTILALAVLSLGMSLGLASSAAFAAPVAPVQVGAGSMISQIAYGCGPGMTRGPYGHCRPRFTCPPGWYPGPAGFHCFRNRW